MTSPFYSSKRCPQLRHIAIFWSTEMNSANSLKTMLLINNFSFIIIAKNLIKHPRFSHPFSHSILNHDFHTQDNIFLNLK